MNQPSAKLLSWEDDKDTVCRTLKNTSKLLKLLLKTKNDDVFLRRWYEHHSKIAGADGIIIFDNGSTKPEVLEIYREIAASTPVIVFKGLHNNIHDTRLFKELYGALAESCKYFCFLDTDEFLTIYDDGKLQHGTAISEFLETAEDPVYPALWLENKPGSLELFNASHGALRSGKHWGKPVVNSSVIPIGYINHNCQVPVAHYSAEIDGRFVVKHFSRLYSEQRIAVNISKLAQREFFKTDDHLNEVRTADVSLIQNRQIRAYVVETQDALQSPYEGRIATELSEDEEDGTIQISEQSGVIKFGSLTQRAQFESFLFYGVADGPSLRAKQQAKPVSKETTMIETAPLSFKPHMTSQELGVFEKHISGAHCLLEFGSGGSTVFAASKGVPLIHSVDSDRAWLDRIQAAPEISNTKFVAHHVDIGPIGKWGNPVGVSDAIKWPNYYRDVWPKLAQRPDVILIDGRFRVACTLLTILNCAADSRIIVHDFWSRDEYHEILRYLDCIDRAGQIGVFVAKKVIPWHSLANAVSEYGLDYR